MTSGETPHPELALDLHTLNCIDAAAPAAVSWQSRASHCRLPGNGQMAVRWLSISTPAGLINIHTTLKACEQQGSPTEGLAVCTRPCCHNTAIHSKGISGSATVEPGASAGCSCSMAPHVACTVGRRSQRSSC